MDHDRYELAVLEHKVRQAIICECKWVDVEEKFAFLMKSPFVSETYVGPTYELDRRSLCESLIESTDRSIHHDDLE